MTDPLSRLNPGIMPPQTGAAGAAGKADDDFAALLRQQLEQVSEIQKDADAQVAKVMAGDTENMSEVFVAARKAQVAFSLLMEIRNKLVDAYEEVRNMRV